MQGHDAKNNHATPTARLPKAWRPADPAGDAHLSCSTQSEVLVLGEDVSSLEAFPGQKSGWPEPVWAAAHGELEIRRQISRGLCQLAFLCSYCLFSPGPSQADPAVKPALIPTALPASPQSVWISAVFLVSSQVSSSHKKTFLLLEFCHIRLNHTLHGCF